MGQLGVDESDTSAHPLAVSVERHARDQNKVEIRRASIEAWRVSDHLLAYPTPTILPGFSRVRIQPVQTWVDDSPLIERTPLQVG